MTATAIKKQVDSYLPLLSDKQQTLILEMIKTFLNVDKDAKRITRKQYNKEINEAVDRIEKEILLLRKKLSRNYLNGKANFLQNNLGQKSS